MNKVLEKTNDAALVAPLAHKIWMEYYPDVMGREYTIYVLENYHSLKTIKSDIEKGMIYYLIKDSINPIGYFAYIIDDKGLYISKLYLLKEYRGKNIMEDVFSLLTQEARLKGKKIIYLNVNKHNVASIKYYQRKGFSIIEDVNIPIGPSYSFDDYIMAKEV
ncbi:MAG: GNAT family N-acetyltransferase [Bacillales bacterium]|nr:GNAT family N-acetyltransferase [Bacillales bacterium]